MASVGIIGQLHSATNLLRADTATAGLGLQLPSSPWTTEGNNGDKLLGTKWYVPVGFIDRDTYTTTDNVTIDITVTSGPKGDPSQQTTKSTVLDETITTVVDPTNGTTTTERVVTQPQSSSDSTGNAPAATTQPPGNVETTVTISDQRTTTETSYSSQMSGTSPTGTTNTITISNVAHSTQQLSEDQNFANANMDATLQSLSQFFANPANLKGMLVGAYAPQFENVQSPSQLIDVQG